MSRSLRSMRCQNWRSWSRRLCQRRAEGALQAFWDEADTLLVPPAVSGRLRGSKWCGRERKFLWRINGAFLPAPCCKSLIVIGCLTAPGPTICFGFAGSFGASAEANARMSAGHLEGHGRVVCRRCRSPFEACRTDQDYQACRPSG